jgi:hypothetical protein
LVDRLALRRELHTTLRPLYDEIVVGVEQPSADLVTAVFRATRRGVLRVVQITRSDGCGWALRSCDEVPVAEHAGYAPPGHLDYSDRSAYLAPS